MQHMIPLAGSRIAQFNSFWLRVCSRMVTIAVLLICPGRVPSVVSVRTRQFYASMVQETDMFNENGTSKPICEGCPLTNHPRGQMKERPGPLAHWQRKRPASLHVPQQEGPILLSLAGRSPGRPPRRKASNLGCTTATCYESLCLGDLNVPPR